MKLQKVYRKQWNGYYAWEEPHLPTPAFLIARMYWRWITNSRDYYTDHPQFHFIEGAD